MTLEEYFLKLRFDKNHHLGCGDIRLTLGQQDELLAMFGTRPEGEFAFAKSQLRAVLEGLQCERIDILMTQGAPTLLAVAEEIAKAAKLGAHLYHCRPQHSSEPKP